MLRSLEDNPPLLYERITHRQEWHEILKSLPDPHVLQTWDWGEFKRATTGWTPERWVFRREVDGSEKIVAAANVLTRALWKLPISVMYVPKGPIVRWEDPFARAGVLSQLEKLARRNHAIFVKIDPDVPVAFGEPDSEEDRPNPTGRVLKGEMQARSWKESDEQIQFRNTIQLDLTQPEDDILMGMKQKTRYNVRLAGRKGVTVREGTPDDLEMLYDLYVETGVRGDFVVRPENYYRRAWGDFMRANMAKAFIAEYEGQPLAHLILFHFGERAWYFYGASSDAHRDRMPTYLLQWEAMKWAKAQGYRTYDFWGAPNTFTEDDPMWGVYRFKEGFGGQVVRTVGAWDYATARLTYGLYTNVMPRILDFMRGLGRLRNLREAKED
jgi:lipid II:glycine glycyltransferase (peptidoglycan interpeptide bridge formation enzyme)